MTNRDSQFVWSDGWCIENNECWFVDGGQNFLYCLNFGLDECEYKGEIPDDNSNKFRLNPRCIKCGNEIFCIPDMGNSIWIYKIKEKYFSHKIEIENPKQVRLAMTDFWKIDDSLWIVSCGLAQVIEINIKEKKIENYYSLCESAYSKISKSIKVGMDIYCTSAISSQVFQFNIESKTVISHKVQGVQDSFHTIVYDEEKFWLSGYHKAIYVWYKDKNIVQVLDEFPQGFGSYDFTNEKHDLIDCKSTIYDMPIFIESRVIGQYVWFIPFQTNQIIYIDKNNHQLSVFHMDREDETRKSLSEKYISVKYLVQYLFKERYLGLYSFKNNSVIEIDTIEKRIKRKQFLLNSKSAEKVASLHDMTFQEKYIYDRIFFEKILSENLEELQKNMKISNDVGIEIWKELI